jgi:ESCRT-I complex subunit VPS28
MLRLVGDGVPSIEEFMTRYRVSPVRRSSVYYLCRKMDHPAALHRLKVGVPATVEHSSEAGPETSKWVAETRYVI